MITVKVEGLERINNLLGGITRELEDTIAAAGEEAGNMILRTQGLQNYPPATAANAPPTPYYIRGRGTQIGGVRVPEYNNLSSKRLGTRWTVTSSGMRTRIGNSASYAPFVHGEVQAWFMAAHGWLKLSDTAQSKLPEITQIYQAWIDRLISKLS
jgi:hypothetical protein